MMDSYKLPQRVVTQLGLNGATNQLERLKEMYPRQIKGLSLYVEKEVEKHIYYGSFIYDEYPDKVTIYGMVKRIYRQQAEGGLFDKPEEQSLIEIIIELLIYNEIFVRRDKSIDAKCWIW